MSLRVSILKCPVDVLTMRETIDEARSAMRGRRSLRHVAINVAKIVHMRSDPILASDVTSSDLAGIDGMGVVFAARALGIRVTERVAGIDLFLELMAVCANEGFRPYFLGGTEQVVRQAASNICECYPAIRIAGIRNGYFTAAEELGIVQEISDSAADCLFIGMPTPRKERFLAAHSVRLGAPFVMGVGGSFDVVAGKVGRAPKAIQKAGLEWLYRVYQEPRRMWWRYAKTNTIFSYLLLRELTMRMISRGADRGLASSK